MSEDDASEQQLSNKKFCTIGEVAKSLNVEQHVLRFWEEKFSVINPMKRRGRRLYNCNDIKIIKTIKHLLYDQGYTIKGVQKELVNKANKRDNATELNSVEKIINNPSSCLPEEYRKSLSIVLNDMLDMKHYLLEKINGA